MSFLERLKESLVPCTPSVRKKSFFWTKNRLQLAARAANVNYPLVLSAPTANCHGILALLVWQTKGLPMKVHRLAEQQGWLKVTLQSF
jgi:hypothetical protein